MFIAVRSYDNYIPANLMLQRLEEEGIRAYLQDELTVTIDPILSNAIGGIKLMIYNEQLERALELISSYENIYREAVICPQCGSKNVHYITHTRKVTNKFTAIISWLFGNHSISLKKTYQCSDCSYHSDSMPA